MRNALWQAVRCYARDHLRTATRGRHACLGISIASRGESFLIEVSRSKKYPKPRSNIFCRETIRFRPARPHRFQSPGSDLSSRPVEKDQSGNCRAPLSLTIVVISLEVLPSFSSLEDRGSRNIEHITRVTQGPGLRLQPANRDDSPTRSTTRHNSSIDHARGEIS